MIAQETVEQVPIGKVKPAPDNIRASLGDVSELAMSIKGGGIQQPIVAVQRNGHFEVVFGHRRLAAAELAGADTVPLIVRDYDERERVIAMAAENLQRENLSPLEEAHAYERLLQVCNCSQRDLAPRIGKTQSHISKRLSLLQLPKDVAAKVDSGGIAIADAVELAKLAEHPKRLKHALESSPWQDVATRVRVELEDLAREQKVQKLAEELESRGIATVLVSSEWQLPKGVHRLKGGSGYDAHALQITAAKHESEPCHAIAITKGQGLKFPVCTNRSNHPKVKTQQEADRASSSGSGSVFKQPRETPAEKERREAREQRLQFAAGLAAKKPPKEALTLILRKFVLQQLEYLEGNSELDRAAIWLGLAEPEEGTTLVPDDVDVEALLIEFAAAGDTQLQRAAFALTAADIDSDGWNGVDAVLAGRAIRGENLTVSAYLEFLRSQGYQLGKHEQKHLDEASATPAEAA